MPPQAVFMLSLAVVKDYGLWVNLSLSQKANLPHDYIAHVLFPQFKSNALIMILAICFLKLWV